MNTVKVKLTMARVGPGISQSAGEIVEVSESEARFLISHGEAEPVQKVERATKKRRVETRDD